MVAGKSPRELREESKDGVSFKARYGLQIDTVETERITPWPQSLTNDSQFEVFQFNIWIGKNSLSVGTQYS